MKQYIHPVLIALTLALPALAQETKPVPADKMEHSSPSGEEGSGWMAMVGLMGSQRPSYRGSDENQTVVDPIVMFDYKGRVGFRESRIVQGAAGFYVRPLLTESWSLGILAMPQFEGREESSAKALKGMGNRDSNIYTGMDLSFRTRGFSATLEVQKGTKSHSGTVAGLTLEHSVQFNKRFGLEAGLTGIWGDKDYQAWEFGITPDQARRRQALINAGNTDLKPADGLAYTPKAGLHEVRARVMLSYQLSERWMVFNEVSHGRLLGDAAKSPLTRSRNQTAVSLGCAYQFGAGEGHGHHAD